MTWFSWALCSAFFAGLTAILTKVGVQHVDSNLATAVRTTVVVIAAWLVAMIAPRLQTTPLSSRSLTFLILSGLATAASWLCYFRALQLGKASQVAPVDKLSVLFTLVLAAVFLGEMLTWMHWLGGSLIALGVVILAVT